MIARSNFGEHSHHLKKRLACGCAGVEALLVQVQVNVFGVKLAKEREEVLQRTA
jgi:hypothetical protein